MCVCLRSRLLTGHKAAGSCYDINICYDITRNCYDYIFIYIYIYIYIVLGLLCDEDGHIGEKEFQEIMRRQIRLYTQVCVCVCVCVCVRASARAREHPCVYACLRVFVSVSVFV